MIADRIAEVSIGLFFLIAFVYFLKLLQALLLHRTLRDAINRDSAYAGSLIERLGAGAPATPRLASGNDDRSGLVLIAIGIALAGLALIVDDPDWVRYGLGAALFPTLVGAALVLRHRLVRRSAGRDEIAAGA